MEAFCPVGVGRSVAERLGVKRLQFVVAELASPLVAVTVDGVRFTGAQTPRALTDLVARFRATAPDVSLRLYRSSAPAMATQLRSSAPAAPLTRTAVRRA